MQHASNNEGILGLAACGIGVSIQAEAIRTFRRSGVVMRAIDDAAARIPTVAAWRDEAGDAVKERLVAHVKALDPVPSKAGGLVTR